MASRTRNSRSRCRCSLKNRAKREKPRRPAGLILYLQHSSTSKTQSFPASSLRSTQSGSAHASHSASRHGPSAPDHSCSIRPQPSRLQSPHARDALHSSLNSILVPYFHLSRIRDGSHAPTVVLTIRTLKQLLQSSYSCARTPHLSSKDCLYLQAHPCFCFSALLFLHAQATPATGNKKMTNPADVHASAIVIDTHADTPQRFVDENWNFTDPLKGGMLNYDSAKKGSLDAQFFSIWVDPGQYPADASARRTLDPHRRHSRAGPSRTGQTPALHYRRANHRSPQPRKIRRPHGHRRRPLHRRLPRPSSATTTASASAT